jgi:hypothetical protein
MYKDKGEYLNKKDKTEKELKEKLLYDGETLEEKKKREKEYQENSLNE